MKYPKIINLLDNTTIQPSKFWTKKKIDIGNDARGAYDIRVKPSSKLTC